MLKKTIRKFQLALKYWQEDGASTQAAALAYYTLFAIGPLLLVILSVVGLFYSQNSAKDQLFSQMTGIFGQSGAELIQGILSGLQDKNSQGFARIAGTAGTILAAAGLINNLRNSLEKIWKSEKSKGGIWSFVYVQIIDLLGIILLGGFWLSLLIASSILSVLGSTLNLESWLELANFGIFILATAVLTMFGLKLLINVKIPWKALWIGSLFTSVLLFLGKIGITFYLSKAGMGDAFGTAGSVVVFMLWIYYSAQIFFFGIEFTKALSIPPIVGKELDDNIIYNNSVSHKKSTGLVKYTFGLAAIAVMFILGKHKKDKTKN